MTDRVMRAGDIVHHLPSGERWLVAWADHESGHMAPCGWPTCQARIEDCVIEKAATDEECEALMERVAASGRSDAHKARQIAERKDKPEK